MAERSIRLTFRYDADGLRLAARTPRRSPPPPSQPVDPEPPHEAIVLELRSAAGEVRYRSFLVDPIPQTLEVGSGEGGLRRVVHAPPSGSFSAVVPPPQGGALVVVSAGPAVRLAQPGLQAGPGRWRELLRTSAERP